MVALFISRDVQRGLNNANSFRRPVALLLRSCERRKRKRPESQPMHLNLDTWDYITFAALAVITLSLVLLAILILGLPGKIAIARKHPEAEAVKLMGWVGFLAIIPWIQALIWAFKPTDVVDIRRFPREERIATEQEIARAAGREPGRGTTESEEKTTTRAPGRKDREET
jgi:hypothetical protein